jgi:hypothetical protein
MASGIPSGMDSGNAYFRVASESTRGLVRIVRTSEAMPKDAEAVQRVFAELVELLRRFVGHAALIDLRHGPPGRNDDGFERATHVAQIELARTFTRVAFLVRSAVGRLQVRRLSRGSNVFLDEQEALRYLAQRRA